MSEQTRPTALEYLALGLTVLMLVPLGLGVKNFASYEPIGSSLAWVGGIVAVAVFLLTGPWFKSFGPDWSRIVLRVSGGLSVTTLALIFAGCFVGYIGAGTPAPPASITDPVSQSAAVLTYAQSLTYSDGHHAMDEQWLEVKDSVSRQVDSIIGPRARIFPEANSHRNGRSALVGIGPGSGRIVARIEVEQDTRRGGGHAKLGLPAGTSYLWIDSLAVDGDSVSVRALVISTRGAQPLRNSFYIHYPRSWASYAQARWQFDPQDPCMCESCAAHGWCRVCGPT